MISSSNLDYQEKSIQILLAAWKILPYQVIDDSELGFMYTILYTFTWLLKPENINKSKENPAVRYNCYSNSNSILLIFYKVYFNCRIFKRIIN